MEVGARFHRKQSPKSLLEVKNWIFIFLGCFSKAKTGKCDQKNRSFSDKSGMIMPGSDTYFLEVCAHLSLKIATDDSFRDKETMKS